jgi:hypothetical protein
MYLDLSKYYDILMVKEEDEEPRDVRLARIRKDMDEAYNLCCKVPDDTFPEYLYKPMLNEHPDDNYIERTVINNNPIVIEARMIRRLYSDYYDYLDALSVYHEYMDYLGDTYGSKKIAKRAIKEGILPDYLPPKPKLKKKKKNRVYLENPKVNFSRKDESIASFFDLKEAADANFGPVPEEDLYIDFGKTFELDKDFKKALREYNKKQERKIRKSNIFKRETTNKVVIEEITKYMNGDFTTRYDKKGKDKVYDSISSIYEELHEHDGMDEEMVEILDKLENDTSLRIENGRLRRADYDNQLNIYKTLMDGGFDIIGIASGTMDKKAVKVLKEKKYDMEGDNAPLTDKEIKKLRKKKKKKYKKALKKMARESKIRETLLKNKVDVASFVNKDGSVEFRLTDLFDEDGNPDYSDFQYFDD